MADEWDQAYNAVQATPAPTSGVTPEPDEWDDIYDATIAGADSAQPRDRGTYPQRLKGASARGWMQLGESVLRLPALVVGQAKLVSSYAQAEQIHAAKDPTEQKLLRQGMKRSEDAYDNIIGELSRSAEWHTDGQQRIIENHPEWESAPPKNIGELLLSPDKLSIALAESLPTLVSAGVLTAAGQPHVASALMFATESNQAFHEAKQNGESDDTARDAAVVYGTVAAVIEQMQLGHIMKIGKGAYKSILNRTVQKVSKDGVKNLTKAVITIAAKEAGEEMAQGTWGEITAKAIYDKTPEGGVKGFVDRRAQEAYIGFMMGVIPGGGGAAAGKIMGGRASQQAGADLPSEVRTAVMNAESSVESNRILEDAVRQGDISRTDKLKFQTNLTPKQIKQVLKLPSEDQKDAVRNLEYENIKLAEQEGQQTEAYKNIGKETDVKIKEADLRVGKTPSTTPPATIEDLIRRGQPNAIEEAQSPTVEGEGKAFVEKGFLHPDDIQIYKKAQSFVGKINTMFDFGKKYPDGLKLHPKRRPQTGEGVFNTETGEVSISVRNKNTKDLGGEWWKKPIPESEVLDTLAHEIMHAYQRGHNKSTRTVDAEFLSTVKSLWQAPTAGEGTETLYTLVETQSGMEIHDKQTRRIVAHFDNFDKDSDKKAVKRLNEINSDPKLAAKYDKVTTGQKARITLLGKRLGFVDKKGKTKPAFRRLMKGVTGETTRSKMTFGQAKKLITTMEKHQPTFREGDKVTPSGYDTVGEVIQINKKRGLATVQFKNKTTGDTSSRIFNMEELAFLGRVQVATEEMVETIRESQKITTPKDEVLGQKENRLLKKYWQKTKRQITGWHLGQLRVARMLEWLDGHEKGVNWHRIFLPMNEASMGSDDAINQRLGDLQGFMLEAFGPDVMKKMLTGKRTPVTDPMFRDKISLSSAERIGYYVLAQNKDGLRRLKRGNLGSFGNREQALKAVLESVTEQEKQLGDWALEQLQNQYPRANQAALIALGRELTPADNYFPLYTPADSKDLDQQVDFLTELEESAGVPKTSLEISETQERVETSTGPVETDFFRSYLHNIARVERFIGMAPAVNEVQNLLNNRDYRHTLNKATNGYGVKILHNWMKDTTKGKSSEVNDWTGKLLTGLRRNAMVYAIGFNIPSVMRQTLSLGNAIAIDPLMMKHIPMNWAKNKQSWKNYRSMENEVMGKSIMMRTRSFDRVESILNSLSATQKRLLGKKDYSRKALGWIRWMDRHTTVLAWKSLYDVALDRKMSEEQATAFADDGISKTQPMGNARDLPDFFRGGPLQKLLTTFQNQVNQNYNFWTHDIAGELKAGKISKKTAAHRVMFSYVMPALLFGMIGRGGPPKDWKDIVKDLALYPLGSLFLVGRIIYNAAQGFAGGGTSVAEIGISELEKTIAAGFRGDVGKVVKHGIKATGALTGRIPAQAIRTAEGVYDFAQNETDDFRRLIYSEWALSRGVSEGAPVGRKRKLRRRTGVRKRKLRRR